MDDGTLKIILAVISLLGTIVTVVLVPYIKSKTTEKQRDNIYTLNLNCSQCCRTGIKN